MDATEFKHELIQNAKISAAESGEGTCASFVDHIAEYLIESEVMPDFIPCFTIPNNGRNTYRVDGYSYDEFDGTIYLVVADFDNINHVRTLTNSIATKSFEKVKHFLDAAVNSTLIKTIDISTPAYDLISTLRDRISSIQRIRIFLFTDAEKSTQLKEIEQDSFNGIVIEKQIWDVERIFKLCCLDDAGQTIEIDFKKYTEKGIPCLDTGTFESNKYRSYLGVIPGKVLADIYDNYGSKLLESNVRSFLSTKVAVNKKIRSTLMNKPDMFFAFNNGISATAKNVKIENTDTGYFITAATDFQIINGGQTTASISSARFKDKVNLDKVFVQMKLTDIQESSSEDAELLIKDISRSSNSQNKVSDADFFASHPFHRTMEQISRYLFAPPVFGAQYETKWFYERARGQYLQEQMRLTPAKKKAFEREIPKDHVIRKTDLAKVQNSWQGNPHIVSKGAQTNFTSFAEDIEKAWETDNSVFNERYFESTVSLILIFQYLEKAISAQAWYQGGYRANVIYYSVALFHLLIKNQYANSDLDLMKIWNKQSVPDPIKANLIEIAKLVMECITSPSRHIVNVTQWCKRQECWSDVKKISFELHDLENYLISKEDEKSEKSHAKKDQKIVNDINLSTEVFNYGAEFWKRVNDFVIKNGIVTPSEVSILRIAVQLPNKIPNTYQCKKLLDLLNRAIEEGFSK